MKYLRLSGLEPLIITPERRTREKVRKSKWTLNRQSVRNEMKVHQEVLIRNE